MVKKIIEKLKKYYSRPMTLAGTSCVNKIIYTLVFVSIVSSGYYFDKDNTSYNYENLIFDESLDINNPILNYDYNMINTFKNNNVIKKENEEESKEEESQNSKTSVSLDKQHFLNFSISAQCINDNTEINEEKNIDSSKEIKDSISSDQANNELDTTDLEHTNEDTTINVIDNSLEENNSKDYLQASEGLTLLEKESIARYIFDVTDDYKWKECVCTIITEGGKSYEEAYNITTTVLNQLSSNRFVRYYKHDNFYERLTGGSFTAYKGGNFETYIKLDLDSLRELPGYAGIIDCLFSQKLSHNYGQFRAKYKNVGIQLAEGGNRYLDPIDDYLPITERDYYQTFLSLMNNPDNELTKILLKVSKDDMECLQCYYEQNPVIEEEIQTEDQSLNNPLENLEINGNYRIKRRVLTR